MQHRPEIDGLRSLAILPVLLFHADFSFFARGYLGVDIFFVISGYLITNLILQDIRQKKFSISNFYVRRAKRLLPALFFVLCVSSVVAWLSLLPADMLDFAKSLLAALTFTSNFYFWTAGDYFAADSALRPLLHLWSLGIEEQFYLLFPWVLLWHRGYLAHHQHGGRWLLGAAVLSLSLAIFFSVRHPSAVFYLPITRMWELLAGAVAAWYGWGEDQDAGKRRKSFFAWLGLLVVSLVLLWPYDLPWPVLTVSLPLVLGTVLVLAYARGNSAVAWCLSLPPLVFIGWISYSAYLWHQPVFAFMRHHLFPLEGYTASGAVLAVLMLAAVSWRWVEQPFRGHRQAWGLSDGRWGQIAACLALGLALMMSWVWSKQGVPSRYSQGDLGMVTYAQDNFHRFTEGYRVGTCFLDEHAAQPVFGEVCQISGVRDQLIWGDSHAAALYQGIALLPQERERWAQFTASGCPPLVDFEVTWRPLCRSINNEVMEQIRIGQPKQILLHANWLLYKNQGLNIEAALEQTVSRLLKIAPHSQIFVLGGIPQWQPSLPLHILHRKVSWEAASMQWLNNYSLDPIYALDGRLEKSVMQGMGDLYNKNYIVVLDILCQKQLCPVTAQVSDEWMPFAWDYGHMTTAGAQWLAFRLKEKIAEHAEK